MNTTSSTSARYVGLDVHKRTIQACIMDADGQVIHSMDFATTRQVIERFANQWLRNTDHVALEATTNCWAVAALLKPRVASVTVSNPMTTRAIAKAKVKTDKIDARVLAHLLRCNYLPPVWHRDGQTQRMRQLTGRRAALVQQRTRLRNRIHSVLQPYRYAIPRSTQTKLARLRVRATGQKRKSGSPKGTKCTAKLPGGSRTIKSLDRIYAEEGLPQRKQDLPPGERNMLQRTGCIKFIQSTASDQLVPRTSTRPSR